MRGLKTRLFVWVNRNPTLIPVLVSTTGIVMAASLSSLIVALGLHEHGLSFILLATGLASLIAIPAGFVHYTREKQIARQQETLRALASTDALTGALNRRTFETAVGKEQLRMRRNATQAAIIMFDLDWFKTINDTFGHAAGDGVLKAVAEAARTELRCPSDAIARWGGEEFAILLSDVSMREALLVADRLRTTISGMDFNDLAPGLTVTASFGVRAFSSACGLRTALIDADRALYKAKHAGRNRVVSASLTGPDQSSTFAEAC